jgi:hypothetical protein
LPVNSLSFEDKDLLDLLFTFNQILSTRNGQVLFILAMLKG